MGRGPDHKELTRRARMWASGISIREIANECCVTEHTIECYVRKHSDLFPYRHATSTPEERESARMMRSSGMTYMAIAEALGRDISTVVRWCGEEGKN